MQDRLETIREIKQKYERRKESRAHLKYTSFPVYQAHVVRERQHIYAEVVHRMSVPPPELRFLEVGAGHGNNLPFFRSLGLLWDNIYVNELLEERMDVVRKRVPSPNLYPGDALDLPFEGEFDIVFQSTVFTSIQSEPFRIALARKIWKMIKPNGIVLWYDFIYDNPVNPDVRKVTREDVVRLFPEARSMDFHSVTLAPPIGRRIGHAYGWMNALFPFLRSHLIAAIHK